MRLARMIMLPKELDSGGERGLWTTWQLWPALKGEHAFVSVEMRTHQVVHLPHPEGQPIRRREPKYVALWPASAQARKPQLVAARPAKEPLFSWAGPRGPLFDGQDASIPRSPGSALGRLGYHVVIVDIRTLGAWSRARMQELVASVS